MLISSYSVIDSLGCKAVFLLGGPTRDDPPLAMFVRSGDVVLMAGSARHCFHGTSLFSIRWFQMHRFNDEMRNDAACDTFFEYSCILDCLCPGVPRIFSDEKEAELPDFSSVPDIDGAQLNPILKYLESSRINVNIRQVHWGAILRIFAIRLHSPPCCAYNHSSGVLNCRARFLLPGLAFDSLRSSNSTLTRMCSWFVEMKCSWLDCSCFGAENVDMILVRTRCRCAGGVLLGMPLQVERRTAFSILYWNWWRNNYLRQIVYSWGG